MIKQLPYTSPTSNLLRLYTLINKKELRIFNIVVLRAIKDNDKPTAMSRLSCLLNNTRAKQLWNGQLYNSVELLVSKGYITQYFISYRNRPARRWTITTKGNRFLNTLDRQVIEMQGGKIEDTE